MRRVVIAGCLLLALTACRSQEPIEPTPTPKPTSTTSSTADPDLKAPTLPAQARKNTPEGAAAFVGYWVRTFNYASATGDTRLLSASSASSCAACGRYVSTFRKVYDRGGYFRGGDWRIDNIELQSGGQTTVVYCRLRADAPEYKPSASQDPRAGETEKAELVFDVRWSQGRWQITRLERSVS